MHLLHPGPTPGQNSVPLVFRQISARLLLVFILAATALAQSPIRHKERTQRFLRGRQIASNSAALLAQARAQHALMAAAQPYATSQTTSLSTAWTQAGPLQVLTPKYGLVTGRITSIVLDPTDPSGNTVYLGTTGGGLWKSTNAAGPASAVTFAPLTDTLPVFSPNAGSSVVPSLSIGALAIGNGILLAGTGDPNDASDSYYGSGLLRSPDGGATWTLIQSSQDGASGFHSFFGLAFAGLAFSTANPSIAVAAVSQAAESSQVNAGYTSSSVMGLYYSTDAAQTWHLATVNDGSVSVESPQKVVSTAATAVVWNPIRQRFYAALRGHGYYESADGQIWTRLTNQPATTLTQAACPTNGSTTCPIFRGALAVQPASGDLFALTVDTNNQDQGLYRDACNLTASACASSTVLFADKLTSTPLDTSSTNLTIPQADYNLTLAATPSGTDPTLYAGTIDLYRCTVSSGSTPGCTLRNTTNAANGCTNPAGVAPAQHALALLNSLVYIGNDGGLYRSTDAVNQQSTACSIDDATHFQNLNSALGSLAEVVSFAQHPTDPYTLIAGLGALGSAGTYSAPNIWPQLATGEGGSVAIDQSNPSLWYLSTAAGVSIARCTKGSACTSADFTTTIAATQTANDVSAIDAPWLLDPQLSSNVLIGTCRAWRGPASSGVLWSSSNLLSRPFGDTTATACSTSLPVVRSLAAGGPAVSAATAQNSGSQVLYAGLAGIPAVSSHSSTGYGHLLTTSAANLASGTTVWTDTSASPVTNTSSGVFNPGIFDISSIAADPHDSTGHTIYVTLMGFAGNGLGSAQIYRSTDAGTHWLNISSNLPNAPANSVVVDPNDANTVYIALDTGVYVTTAVTTCATTNCWSVYGTALPNAPVVQLLAAPSMSTVDGRTGQLRAATYGRGIWQIPLITAISPNAPGLSASPTTLTFASQQVATTSAAQTVTVTNTGTASLTVSSVVPTGDFLESDTCTTAPIAPQATCTVQVSFFPSATGSRTGLLTIYGNAPGGQATVTLSGTGTPAAPIVLTPTTLTFPATVIGATSAIQNITVANTGTTVANLQTPTITGDFKLNNGCVSNLSPQNSCTLSITFTPTAAGTRTGALTLVDSAGTQTAALSGPATSPATDALSPSSLTFAPQQLNTTSATQTLTLLNSGDVALTLIAAQVTSGDFTVANSCGNSLNAHSTCTLAVAFAPHSLAQQSGTLAISDQYRTQTVTLSGSGLAPPGVSLSPTVTLAFTPTAVATTSTAQTVTLTNNGGVTLTLTSIAVSGDFALQTGTNTCPSTLTPAAVCTFSLAFTPTAPGPRTGLLTVLSNAPNSPRTLALTGSGVDFTFNANGAAAQTIVSGQTATFPLLLTSATGVPGNVLFTCSGVPAHALCTVNPTNPALGSTANITATIATGLTTANLTPPPLPWTPNPYCVATLIPALLFLRKRRRLAALTLILLTLTSCSSGRTVPGSTITGPTGSNPVTPSGTYNLVVAASSANLVRTVNLTLTIQ